MASKKWTHCKVGHELNQSNLYVNSEGWRECKTCADRRGRQSQRERRAAMKWLGLIVRVGERRIAG